MSNAIVKNLNFGLEAKDNVFAESQNLHKLLALL